MEIDGVVLAGRSRRAVAVAEAKWARRAGGDTIARSLRRRAERLPRAAESLELFVAAREEVTGSRATPITAADSFGA